jgi:hypothetical protein
MKMNIYETGDSEFISKIEDPGSWGNPRITKLSHSLDTLALNED